jgi:hypothetical protein
MLSGWDDEEEAGALLGILELALSLGFWDWGDGVVGPEAANWQMARRPAIWSWGQRSGAGTEEDEAVALGFTGLLV